MRLKTSFFIISFLVAALLQAQDFRGVIKSEITYEDVSVEMKPVLRMLPTQSNTYIRDNMAKVVTPSPNGEQIVIMDMNTNEMLQLTDAMGNKIAVKTDLQELKEKQEAEDPELEFSDETKEILGYQCKKVWYEKDGNEVIIYYTEELPNVNYDPNFKTFEGFPLQIKTIMENMTIVQTVTEVSEEKGKKIKMKVPGDYKKMTLEEVLEMQRKASAGAGM